MTKVINTKCEKCIFKIIENSKQVGCQLDIDQIITKNYPGLYDNATIDKSGSCWTLKNFKCSYARTHEWLQVLKSSTEENPIDRVIKDSFIPYYMVIILNSQEDDIDDIINDFEVNQIYKPAFVSLILTHKSAYKSKELIHLLEQASFMPKWKLHYIQDSESTISEMVDLALETNLDNAICYFIYIKYADTLYRENSIKRINETVNHCLGKKMVLFTDNFIDGLVVDKELYVNLNKQIGVVYDYLMNDEEIHKIKLL